jgi:hypothetical protein
VIYACKEAVIMRIVVQTRPSKELKGSHIKKKKSKSHKRVIEIAQGAGCNLNSQ